MEIMGAHYLLMGPGSLVLVGLTQEQHQTRDT